MKKLTLLWAFMILSFWVLAQQKDLPYVVLISFDGFRADYVERFDLKNFKSFIKSGGAAEALIPSFPSKTFPNHYTLVTGLYPGHHGLVDNTFFDPSKNQQYGMRIREAVIDPSYYGGTPLWILARQNNVKSASYFWVGSELKQDALHPDYYLQYDQSVPFQKRVDQVFEWLKLPEAERPHMITLYFSSPDSESHSFGPLAEQTREKLFSLDSLLGNFMSRVKETKLPINVVLVSDHGMSELTQNTDTYIMLDDLVKTKKNVVTVVNGGTQAHLYTNPIKRDSIYSNLKSRENNFKVYKQESFPTAWHYAHERSGDLLIVVDNGRYLMSGTIEKLHESMKPGTSFGAHGYDPYTNKDMYGIFYANGPNIKPGSKIKAVQNIHVYPLVAEILKMKVPQIDGQFKEVKGLYKK
jgi:predicted AlkP superfamily pyrophosphatase or phosphodiesterase